MAKIVCFIPLVAHLDLMKYLPVYCSVMGILILFNNCTNKQQKNG